MKLHMNTAIMELVNPGLYGTRLGEMYEEIDEYYDKNFKESLCDWGKDHMQGILNQKLISKEIGKCTIDNVSFHSPQWYNYENDWFEFDLTVSDDIQKIIKENIDVDFFKWIEKEYHSYDGFISFMPYTKERYIAAFNGEDVERAVAMYIMYLLKCCDVEYTLEECQEDFEDDIDECVLVNGWYYEEEDEDYD